MSGQPAPSRARRNGTWRREYNEERPKKSLGGFERRLLFRRDQALTNLTHGDEWPGFT